MNCSTPVGGPCLDQPSRVGTPSQAVLDIYLFLNVFPSHLALPILIASLIALKARRNATLINMCVTWVIAGVVSSLLFYFGKQSGPEPPPMLCVAQASFVYSIPPMVSLSDLALIVQVWYGFVSRPGEELHGLYLGILIVLPYIAFLGFAITGATIGSASPQLVNRARRFFYCSVEDHYYSDSIGVFAGVVMIMAAILQVSVGITLCRNWRAMRPRSNGTDDKQQAPRFVADQIQFITRVVIFEVFGSAGLVLGFLSIAAPRSVVPDMIMASMALGVVVVFGSQPALWSVWKRWARAFLSWRQPPRDVPPVATIDSSVSSSVQHGVPVASALV